MIEIEEVRIEEEDIADAFKHFGVKREAPSTHVFKNKKQPYVRTIPVNWICRASNLPGKTIMVAIAIWFLAGVTRNYTVKLKKSLLEMFGIHPETSRRALKNLEQANLIQVQRDGKKRPAVTLLFPPTSVSQSQEQRGAR